MSHRPDWIDELFAAVDAKDAARFAAFLIEDCVFLFANQPAVAGRAAVRDAVAAFFASIRGLSHEVREATTDGDSVWSRGLVTYVRHDGSSLTVPFATHFTVRDTRIARYQIYVDASALYR